MKKGLNLLLAVLLVCCLAAIALAEPWVCPNCGNTAEGNFCSQCGTAYAAQGGGDMGTVSEAALSAAAEATAHVPVAVNHSPDKYTWYIQDYVGRNLASVGYTSLGGDRQDHYGAANIKLVLSPRNGSLIDLEDTEQFASYVVVGQDIPANSRMSLTYMRDEDSNEYSVQARDWSLICRRPQ